MKIYNLTGPVLESKGMWEKRQKFFRKRAKNVQDSGKNLQNLKIF